MRVGSAKFFFNRKIICSPECEATTWTWSRAGVWKSSSAFRRGQIIGHLIGSLWVNAMSLSPCSWPLKIHVTAEGFGGCTAWLPQQAFATVSQMQASRGSPWTLHCAWSHLSLFCSVSPSFFLIEAIICGCYYEERHSTLLILSYFVFLIHHLIGPCCSPKCPGLQLSYGYLS